MSYLCSLGTSPQTPAGLNFTRLIASRIRHNEADSFSTTVTRVGIASIALALAVGIVSYAVLFGFKATIKEKIVVFGAPIRVSSLGLGNTYDELPLSSEAPFAKQLPRLPSLRHWQGVAHKSGILKTPDEMKGIVLKGIGRDYDTTLLTQQLVEGRMIRFAQSDTGQQAYSSEIILSAKIAKQLRLSLQDEVLVYFVQNPPRTRKLSVVGIYQTDLEEFDNTLVVGDLALIQRLNNWEADQVGAFEIFPKNPDQLEAVAQQVYVRMAPDMYLQTVEETFGPLFDWLLLLDRNTLIFLVLILTVACFNMVSVLLVLIMERTPLVGLLKTLGATHKQIRAIFIRLGTYIILRGLVLGNVLGLGLCWVQQQFQLIRLDPANYYMSAVPIAIDGWVVVGFNLLTLALVWLVLLIPTLAISQIQPVRALLFKK